MRAFLFIFIIIAHSFSFIWCFYAPASRHHAGWYTYIIISLLYSLAFFKINKQYRLRYKHAHFMPLFSDICETSFLLMDIHAWYFHLFSYSYFILLSFSQHVLSYSLAWPLTKCQYAQVLYIGLLQSKIATFDITFPLKYSGLLALLLRLLIDIRFSPNTCYTSFDI